MFIFAAYPFAHIGRICPRGLERYPLLFSKGSGFSFFIKGIELFISFITQSHFDNIGSPFKVLIILYNRHSKPRFLKHAHHDYDVDAAVYVWNHPDELAYKDVSILGEVKDLANPEDIENIKRKKKRGVRGYLIYKLKYKDKVFLIKTERLKWGIEQFYSITEE